LGKQDSLISLLKKSESGEYFSLKINQIHILIAALSIFSSFLSRYFLNNPRKMGLLHDDFLLMEIVEAIISNAFLGFIFSGGKHRIFLKQVHFFYTNFKHQFHEFKTVFQKLF
jgi:hypothetical protein